MKDAVQLEIPLKLFYQRCFSKYRLGERNHYKNAIENSNGRFCFNPYISTECDVQVKLGGLIEEHFIKNKLPYSVNAEMKVYGDSYKHERADLTIHAVEEKTLYTKTNNYIENLKCVIEIKFANAVHPNYEFRNNLIEQDLNMLSSLAPEISKMFVFLDEANGLSPDNTKKLVADCKNRNILLFSNNDHINYLLQYPYGSTQLFWLSKNRRMEDKKYIFGLRSDFLESVKDCFNIDNIDNEIIEINKNEIKIKIYFASEFDKSSLNLEGHVMIETFSRNSLKSNEAQEIFEQFVKKNNGYFFEQPDGLAPVFLFSGSEISFN